VSHCRRTLRGEGRSAGWGMGGSVIAADCGVPKVRSFGQWAAATCAAPSNVIAGQYATSNCKLLLVVECKWRYINVETFKLCVICCWNPVCCWHIHYVKHYSSDRGMGWTFWHSLHICI